MSRLTRLLYAVFAEVTGIPSEQCECGFITRCGMQSRLHSH